MEGEEDPRRILSVARITNVRGKLYEVTGYDNPSVILRHEICGRGHITFHIPVVKFLNSGSLDVRVYASSYLEEEVDYLECLKGAYVSLERIKEWLEKLKRKVTWGMGVSQFEKLSQFSIVDGLKDRRNKMPLLETIVEVG